MTLLEQYRALDPDGRLLGLEPENGGADYFCYPLRAQPIGFEGCIQYCFLEGYGETVFACNPESCADAYVYPLADSFAAFLALALACGGVNPAEQIAWMSEAQFAAHLRQEAALRTPAQQTALQTLSQRLCLVPMEQPYAYVKAIQARFDPHGIAYKDEYYELLGIAR